MERQNFWHNFVALCLLAIPFTFLAPANPIQTWAHQAIQPHWQLLYYGPFFLAVSNAVLGSLLNQSRIIFSSILLLLVYVALNSLKLQNFLPITVNEIAIIFAVSIPVSLSLIFAIDERRLIGGIGLYRLLAILLPPTLLWLGLHSQSVGIKQLLSWQVIANPTFDLPNAAFIPLVIFALLTFFTFESTVRIYSTTYVLSLIPLGYSLSHPERKNLLIATFCCVGLAHLHSIIRLFWQRVYLDELTEIPNRRALNERLRSLGRNYSIAMIDVDHFKQFNDQYGHDEGDNVLRFVAKTIEQQSKNKAYRYGGEEFALIMDGKDLDDAKAVAEQVRTKIAERPFHLRVPKEVRLKTTPKQRKSKKNPDQQVKITVSVGLSQRTPKNKKPKDVMRMADKALYQAKRAGRNRMKFL